MQLLKLVLLSTALFPLAVFAGSWETHQSNLKAEIGKIRAKENHLQELFEAKKKVTDQQQMSDLLADITKTYKELDKDYEGFNKEKEHVRFEHPEHGPTVEHQYRAYRLKTLHEYEVEGGLDGKLTELKKKVSEKYGEPESPSVTAAPAAPADKKPTPDEEREKKRIKMSY